MKPENTSMKKYLVETIKYTFLVWAAMFVFWIVGTIFINNELLSWAQVVVEVVLVPVVIFGFLVTIKELRDSMQGPKLYLGSKEVNGESITSLDLEELLGNKKKVYKYQLNVIDFFVANFGMRAAFSYQVDLLIENQGGVFGNIQLPIPLSKEAMKGQDENSWMINSEKRTLASFQKSSDVPTVFPENIKFLPPIIIYDYEKMKEIEITYRIYCDMQEAIYGKVYFKFTK